MTKSTSRFALAHCALAGLFFAAAWSEGSWFGGWPWYLFCLALIWGGGFLLNFSFARRHRDLDPSEHLFVVLAGPLPLFHLFLVAGWRDFLVRPALVNLLLLPFGFAIANFCFWPSWLGFFFTHRRPVGQVSVGS